MIDAKTQILHANCKQQLAAVTLFGLMLSGCGGPKAILSTSPQIEQLKVTPTASSIALGQTANFAATAILTDGSSKDETNSVTWTSSNGGVASIDATGHATSVSPGNATIVATLHGVTSAASLTVSKAAMVNIAVTPSSSSLASGTSIQLKATGTFTDLSTQDVTNAVTWKTSDPGIAAVSSAGLAASISMGKVSITASAGSVSGSSQLTVTAATLVAISLNPSGITVPAGITAQFTAQGTYSDGSVRDLTSAVSWSSSPQGIASINSSGSATGVKVGTAAIAAQLGGVSGTSTLTVSAAQLKSISISSGSFTIPLGNVEQMTATGTYTDGSTHDLTNSVSWSSASAAIVSVNSSGSVTGLKLGTAAIDARLGGMTGTSTLTVSAAQLKSISISSGSLTIPLGNVEQMTATGTYTDGSTHDLTNSVSWSSASAAIVSVNSSGSVTGLKLGTAAIDARLGGMTGTSTLTVSAAQLKSISISSGSLTIPLGAVEQMTATGTYTDGSTRDLTNSVSWSSASAAIVSIGSGGSAKASALGKTDVSAMSSKIRGDATVTVSPAALSSIAVSPSNPAVPLGRGVQLAAIGSFTDGSTQDVTGSVTWAVNDDSIVSVKSTGYATAIHVGSTGAEASMNGIQGTVTILVEPLAAVGYFATRPNGIDTALRVTNPGSDEPNLCVMVYVFDQDQQMSECCGCRISGDGLRTFSLNKDLIGNPLTGRVSTSGSILLATGDYVSNPSCNASSINPTGTARAWSTHLQANSANSSTVSEEPLSETPLNATLTLALQAQCSFVQQLGGGQGICTCGTGD
ncbi:Ig-like domain-containing protein [Acidicapsa acidisoli]|uniref:Ig-like domain-containing protein n=1 Tax=Acidicapsa acidisoli TaxID=1615681 RepID=UPI0021DF9ADA|nr:Ig-like domain-containing protein [Acidicapsa acidisoli]